MAEQRSPGAQGGLRLASSPGVLWDAYDLAMLDLDGVVYIGAAAVPGVPRWLAQAASHGMRSAFVTNNASRPPGVVAEHLVQIGVPARHEDVVTSAQAAARLVSARVPPGSMVYVIGGDGLFVALEEQGLRWTQDPNDDPLAVVSGFSPDLRWGTVIDGAILVRNGLPWVASNTDLTVPTARGPAPGNGVLVRVVAEHAQATPVVAGKPESPLFRETELRVGGRHALVVGDRLDTDIEGAVRAGYDGLLVMTGVTGVAELAAAPPGRRPAYVGGTLAALGQAHEVPHRSGSVWFSGGWQARVDGSRLEVTGSGEPDPWWQCVAAAAWAVHDETGTVPDVQGLEPPAASSG